MSSNSASTRSSSGSTVCAERVIGFRAELRRKRIPSDGLPKILCEAMLRAFAIAAVGPPTSASGEPGNRSMGLLTLLGELERKDRGRGDEDIE